MSLIVQAFRLLQCPAPLRLILVRHASTSPHLPRVARPALWSSLVPRFFRRTSPLAPGTSRTRRAYENPWSTVIALGLMVGSQAIHTIALKNSMKAESRKAEAKLGLLRDILERVQRGEDVDVERELGTGDPKAEEEWWDVIKEIEDERTVGLRQKEKQEKRAAALAEKRETRAKERQVEKEKRDAQRAGVGPRSAAQVFV